MTRLRWNVTDVETGETYRTYIGGFSVVGSPSLTHGRSPIVSWGLTAINPDVSDVFVEYIKDDQYLSANDQWKPLDTKTEIIKVRFGADVQLPLRFTRNGVIISSELLDGAAHDLVPWVSRDILQNDVVDGQSAVYALGNVYDPVISDQFDWKEPDLNFKTVFDIAT